MRRLFHLDDHALSIKARRGSERRALGLHGSGEELHFLFIRQPDPEILNASWMESNAPDAASLRFQQEQDERLSPEKTLGTSSLSLEIHHQRHAVARGMHVKIGRRQRAMGSTPGTGRSPTGSLIDIKPGLLQARAQLFDLIQQIKHHCSRIETGIKIPL